MPLDPIENRRPPITPQLALRVAGMGVVAFVLFGIVFFRLWYLQVLDGDRYLAQARENRVRTERIQAPRGQIVDRQGIALVENRRATVVSLDPQRISPEVRTAINGWGQVMGRRELRPKGRKGPRPAMPKADPQLALLELRLARVLRISPRTIHQRLVSELVQVPYADVRIKTDVDAAQRNYIEEHRELFPGVKVDQVYLRRYPYGRTAAQLVGTVGEINENQLKLKSFSGVPQGTFIGQEGLEAEYDQYLRGTDGAYTISVNALGERQRAVTARDPQPGRQLRLTLDLGLQQAGEKALANIAGGNPGAFVALDPESGAVLAMGSAPSYDPRDLARPLTQTQYDKLFGESAGSPRFNRAIGAQYATGSIFKPITALAGLATNRVSPSTVIQDAGCLKIGRTELDVRCNAKKQSHGPVDLSRAMTVSSDVYFYQLGLDLNPLPNTPLQAWAKKLGLGHRTGIDLPQEFAGLIPDAAWRRKQNQREEECRKREKRASCGLADGTNRPWLAGDEVSLAIGQGDLQATPLQMAVAYATIANGGRVVRPHLGAQVQDADGRLVQRIEPPAAKRIQIEPSWREAIMSGLKGAASGPGGTSADVFKDWPHNRYPIFGKTGTAQRTGKSDSSWYVAYAYDASRPEAKPIVIAATIEGGGFGAETAAPTVGRMLAKWFNVKVNIARGASSTL
jgi:penicillin-binding protein 2